ncbi:Autophagy-related protein 13 [Phytophthora infestans]|uniref:Autophagy-related protein 13 n=1 Tax=Phytophthora infestans TaxID=4787 RepID=A0A833SJQ1_PHYIN|nr:Autophagy-related protein 13 [Phytophthora infestans]KAF4149355.1 Autophagy-related protein 13 [Phytophthora infestans]
MMSSVDMSNASQSSHPSSQQLSGFDNRYSGQTMRYAAPPPRSSTGRAKTEQVVLEFLYKAAELIVQSRVNFHAEPDFRRSNRRARFNLDIEEVQAVRDSMTPWKEDVRLPLTIDIFWDTGSRKVLLERWSVTFTADGESSSAHLGSTQDVIQQLKEVCKRISVLLRALFSFMRQLPAHRLFTQSYPSMLSYSMHTASASAATRAFEAERVATSGYSFVPIMTPFGRLKVAAVYRRDCDQFTEQQEQAAPSRILPDNFIIQDYVPGSPELTAASAPVTSAAMAGSPLSATDLRTDSFVPVSDTQQFDVGALQRRRSSPRSIPAAQFSTTGPVRDGLAEDDGVVQTQPGMSKPMAIPRISSKGGVATAAGRNVEAVLQQAHSYGGEHDARLRGAVANPNVAAAPYGYGNVAIDRDQERTSSPSLAFQQRQQQLWEGHADRHDTETGLHSSRTSFDEALASHSSAGYHPMSTPPRHPKTVSLLRNDRTSPALIHKLFLENSPVPGSFERFALDTGLPSLAQRHAPERRKSSFSGAFVSDSAESSATAEADGGAQRAEDATPLIKPATKTEAITILPRPSHSPAEGLPVFTASPPFQANPCELLSTSPGYAYTKSQLRSSSCNVPTFVTTDRFQRGVHNAKEPPSAGIIAAKHRGFSPDFGDSGVTAWGVSPDTPDAFGLALADTESSVSGDRQLFSSANVDAGFESSGDQNDDLDAMILPFVINDSSSSANTAVDSVSTGAGSSLSRLSGGSLDTASVGNFLHQLKNAPRLNKSSSTLTPSRSAEEDYKTSDAKQEVVPPPSMFDDELAGFRSLRDELTQLL